MKAYKTAPGLAITSGRLGLPCRKITAPRVAICRAASRSNTGRNGRRRGDSLLDNGETGPVGVAESMSERIRRRRRQRKAEDAQEQDGTTDQFEAGDGWRASEWGPAEQVPPEETEWGWAQDSWSGQVVDDDEPRQKPLNPESEGWDAELNRREQRRRSGARASSTSTASYDDNDDDDDYDGEMNNGGDRSRTRSSVYEPGLGEPDIALLSPQELERILPVVPFSAQAAFFNGGPAQAVQRWGASLALTIVLSKAALLAATSLTWPLWWPWAQAASKNYALRKQSVCAGLWRTQVLEVEARGRPRASFGDEDSGSEGEGSPSPRRSKFSTMRTTRIILGDPEGAQTELVLPHDARFSLVEPGQPAELIVLSSSTSFESFKAVKDVYLPDSGLWLSEYPFLDRTEFLELSLEVEREAAAGELGEDAIDDDDIEDGEWQGVEEGDGAEEDQGEYYYPPGPPPPRY